VFSCNSSVDIPLFITAQKSSLSELTYTNIGLPSSGTGLIYTSTSQLNITNVVLSNGLAQNPPSKYSWRGANGGALFISAAVAPVRILFQGVSFRSNKAACTDHSCVGGAVSIEILNSVAVKPVISESDGVFDVINCVFDSNIAFAYGSADGLKGAGISLSNNGNASLEMNVLNSVFRNNVMENEGTPVVATGGAISLINIDFTTLSVYSLNFPLKVNNCTFESNEVISYLCNSLSSTTANGAALGPFGLSYINISDSSFIGNVVACYSEVTSSASGIAEGGAIFLEGLYYGNPDYLQPVLNITSSVFRGNIANCTGTGCLSLGGGIAVAIAREVLLNDIIAEGNQAICAGISCGAQGGFAQLQNGPESGVGAVESMALDSRSAKLINNIAVALPPGDFVTACDLGTAACDSPTYGGAIAILSWNGGLYLKASDWTCESNSASCANDGCIVFGADVGGGVYTLSDGITAVISMDISSSTFTCSNVTCGADVADCHALTSVWSTDYYSVLPAGSVSINGDGCAFIGSKPPTGTLVNVSGTCGTTESADYDVCFGITPSPSNWPTVWPTMQPTNSTPTDDFPTDDDTDSEVKSLSHMEVIIISVVSSVAVFAMFATAFYVCCVAQATAITNPPLLANEQL
jgi:hypothetical protein